MTPQTLRQRAEEIAYSITNVDEWFDTADRLEIIEAIEKGFLQVEKEALARGREEADVKLIEAAGYALSRLQSLNEEAHGAHSYAIDKLEEALDALENKK